MREVKDISERKVYNKEIGKVSAGRADTIVLRCCIKSAASIGSAT